MNALTVPNGVAVALFGIVLSAAFCDISWTKKNCWHAAFIRTPFGFLSVQNTLMIFWLTCSMVLML